MTTILSTVAIVLYLLLGLLLGKRLFSGSLPLDQSSIGRQRSHKWLLPLGSIAIVTHAVVLYELIFIKSGMGLNLGFYNAASLITWLIVLLLLIASVTKPIENLGIVIFPLASITLLLENLIPSSHIILTNAASELRFHILISILAYSLFSIAAMQAILLAIQNRFLRKKHPGGFIRALPPLETMESLLFQMIAVGFILQTLALLTGMFYLEDMFEQHLVHKTILSIAAWCVFAILLWGRWKFGWRGRTAIRWTMTGFTILLLSYFGSKLVLEIFLNK